MSAAEAKPSALVLRACAMLEVLAGEVPHGLTNKDLAAALNTQPAYVTRTADILIAKGWVEKLPTGKFAVTTMFSRLTFRVLASFEREQKRLQDSQRNFTLPN